MCCRCVLLSHSEAFVYVPSSASASSTSAQPAPREPGRGGARQAGAAAAAAAAAEKRAALATDMATVASMTKPQLIALIRQVAPPDSDLLP